MSVVKIHFLSAVNLRRKQTQYKHHNKTETQSDSQRLILTHFLSETGCQHLPRAAEGGGELSRSACASQPEPDCSCRPAAAQVACRGRWHITRVQ